MSPLDRGIPPSAVENAIQYGAKVTQEGGETILHKFGTVKVITDLAGKVITVMN